jgi:hypothetical protein
MEQKSETIIEFRKENRIFPFWMAFYSFRNFFVSATIRKSNTISKAITRENMILRFQTIIFFEPMLLNTISIGSGAGVMTILDFLP